jgi:hypothetical protein
LMLEVEYKKLCIRKLKFSRIKSSMPRGEIKRNDGRTNKNRN